MSTNYHTSYPAAMEYKTSNLNMPLGELDAQITINVATINKAGFVAGKFAMVNEAGTALVFKDIVCSGGSVVVSGGEVVIN